MPGLSLPRSVRHLLEHGLFRIAGATFRGLGLQRASAVSGLLWRVGASLLKRHGRALGHLAASLPDTTAAEREAIARAMWENLGRTFAEAFFLREIAAEGRVDESNRAVLEAWLDWPGGKVACAAHLANWELAVAPAQAERVDLWSIYQTLKNPRVDADVHAMRAFLYRGGLVAKGPGVPRQFLKVVRDGGTVALLSDLRDYTGLAVPFLGRPAPSTTFPALLAVAAGAPVLVCCMRRLPGVRFLQTYTLIAMPDTGDRAADVAQVTAEIQAVFDGFVRRWPEQWMWAHRRWG